MQISLTDLFIENNNKVRNKTMLTINKTCEDDILSLIEYDIRTEIEKCCSFVIQKQLLLYIIHFTHILFNVVHSVLPSA